MKRPHTRKTYSEPPSIDPTNDLTPKQLQLIGAIAISWNYLERMHNHLFDEVTCAPLPILGDIPTRINGFDGVSAISEKAINKYLRLPDEIRTELADTLNAAKECKTFRDAIIHSTIQMPSGEGLRPKRGGGKTDHDVLLTEEALSYMHKWTVAISAELWTAAWLIDEFVFRARQESKPEFLHMYLGSDKLWSEPELQSRAARYRSHRTHRRSVKPPTKFPPEPPPPQESED